jgi:hypothetical protein
MNDKNKTFEENMIRLEQIVRAMDQGDVPLEESLNRRCASKSLDEKYTIYGESGFTSARNVATRYRDQEFSPTSRTTYLAKLMYNNILELRQFDFSQD